MKQKTEKKKEFSFEKARKKTEILPFPINKKALTGLAATIFMLFSAADVLSSEMQHGEKQKHIVKQMKDLIIPLSSVDPQSPDNDLAALEDVIGDASIVLLGESQHMLREQYQLKHRIIRYMVEEMDFTHILIEDSFSGTIDLDNYIKGADISPEKALRNTGGWYLWDTEEMLALVKWLRSHNDGKIAGSMVSYIGLDIQDPWPGIRHLLKYFRSVDLEFSGYLESQSQIFDIFNKPIWVIIKNSYANLEAGTKQKVEDLLQKAGARLKSHRENYIRSGGRKAYEDTNMVVKHLLKSHEFFKWLETAEDGEVGIREKTMFANVERIRESAGPRAKIIIWAHNAHTAKSPVRWLNTSIPESASLELMGTMLKRKYGNVVKSIGMASLGKKKAKKDSENPPGLLDLVLSQIGMEICFLDFHKLTIQNGVENFLMSPWKLTADQGAYLSLVPLKAFDAMFFIKYITSVRHSPESEKRFQSLFN